MGTGVHRVFVRAAFAFTALALLSFGLAPARAADTTSVIVQATSPSAARAAVERLGGSVTLELPIVSGVAARLRADAVDALSADPRVRAVTPNERVTFAENSPSTVTTASVFNVETRATKLHEEGITGSNVRVALIDTGVSPEPDIAGRLIPVPDPLVEGKMAPCANFSGDLTESGEPDCDDYYGHGTFVAGLIAGVGAVRPEYRGAAPGAEIVSVKIAGRDGSADVTKVLAAIQWVVSFSTQLKIRVLNLSLGTDSRVSHRFDPLNFAVQRAWAKGIVVVVAASNRGPGSGTISKPGDDPYVVTVGAIDDRATPAIDDDRIPRFTGRGPTAADGLTKPDVVAPGARVISLRSPGSFIEQKAPGGGIDSTYRRGSGSSMSTGIVSGISALLLQKHPGWKPNNVKYALMQTARPVAGGDADTIGKGLVDARAASLVFGEANTHLPPPPVLRNHEDLGSLDGSRGTVIVSRECTAVERTLEQSEDCTRAVQGEMTAQAKQFNRTDFVADWDGSSWYDSQWAATLPGSSWYGSSWYGNMWLGSSWYGSSWYGENESQTSYGTPIPGSSWYGAWS